MADSGPVFPVARADRPAAAGGSSASVFSGGHPLFYALLKAFQQLDGKAAMVHPASRAVS